MVYLSVVFSEHKLFIVRVSKGAMRYLAGYVLTGRVLLRVGNAMFLLCRYCCVKNNIVVGCVLKLC